MPRIACIVVGAAAAAISAAASDACAAPRQEHRHSPSSATHHQHNSHANPAPAAPVRTPVSSAPTRAPVVPIVAGYASAYSTSSYGSSRQPLTFARSTVPPVYYMPAISPNAPPFSFNGSEEQQPGWNWQRVSLQQIDAEVRARRAAQDVDKSPAYRQFCPDSRAYYPDVTQCNSEWLTVVAKAAARPAAQPVVASR